MNADENSVAEPANHGCKPDAEKPRHYGDSWGDQGKQGGTASDRYSRGRHGPHHFFFVTEHRTTQ